MKIVKKMKGVISFHFYSDPEMNSILKTIMDFTQGKEPDSLPILTNLFKGTDGDEIGELYFTMSQEENRLYIDNEQKKIVINLGYEDIENFIRVVQLFLKDKRVSTEELCKIMISKKEYVLQGFNQQYKRFLKKKKMPTKNANAISIDPADTKEDFNIANSLKKINRNV